jgi:hypothetical protein
MLDYVWATPYTVELLFEVATIHSIVFTLLIYPLSTRKISHPGTRSLGYIRNHQISIDFSTRTLAAFLNFHTGKIHCSTYVVLTPGERHQQDDGLKD